MQPRKLTQAAEEVYTLARAKACAIAKEIATRAIFLDMEVSQVELWIDDIFDDLRAQLENIKASKHDTDIMLAYIHHEFVQEASNLAILMHLEGGTA